jgi:hypothetical protein
MFFKFIKFEYYKGADFGDRITYRMSGHSRLYKLENFCMKVSKKNRLYLAFTLYMYMNSNNSIVVKDYCIEVDISDRIPKIR